PARRSERAQVIGQLSARRYLELLHEHAHSSLHAIFGDELVRHDWNYAIDKGRGTASLGILRVRRKPDIEVDRYGKLRLRLNDEDKPAFLSVTDVRFVKADHKTIKTNVITDVRERMRRGVDVLLMLSLARAFQRSDDDCERHWLQVNGICMRDQPLAEWP
ncbi:MAG TPA: hypothetical protein VIJ11_03250, partial [Galbitalea sp.]